MIAKDTKSLLNCFHEPKLSLIFWRHWMFQSPLYYLRVVVALIYSFIRSHFVAIPRDQDVIEIVENCSLGMLVRKKTDGYFELDVPKCMLAFHNGGSLHSFKLQYTKEKGQGKIVSFILNDEPISDQCQRYSVVSCYVVFSLHTKCHVFGNMLTHRIIDDKLTMLSASALTTIPLHNALVLSDISPLTGITTPKYLFTEYYFKPTRESFVEESMNMTVFKRHPDLEMMHQSPSPYVTFLFNARRAMFQVLQKYSVPRDLWEALFNVIVVHATDHDGIWGSIQNFRYNSNPCVTHCSFFDNYGTFFRNFMFTAPILNPISTNKLKDLDTPFYKDLYVVLRKVDRRMADLMTASIMY